MRTIMQTSQQHLPNEKSNTAFRRPSSHSTNLIPLYQHVYDTKPAVDWE